VFEIAATEDFAWKEPMAFSKLATLTRLLRQLDHLPTLEKQVSELHREFSALGATLRQLDGAVHEKMNAVIDATRERDSRVTREIEALGSAVRAATRAVIGSGREAGMQPETRIELVRLDCVSLFVPTDDNLYNAFIPPECKGYTLERHCEALASEAPPDATELEADVTRAMLLYLDRLFAQGCSVHLLDLGAWVGDFAVKLGKFSRLRGRQFTADCYDPSEAGTFIPFNAELNGVGRCIVHKPIGLSLTGGPQVFHQIRGHSDSSRLMVADGGAGEQQFESYLIPTVTLEACLPALGPAEHLIVKLDLEGIDTQIALQNLERLKDATLIIEFAPARAEYQNIKPESFLSALLESHALFDLYFLFRPTRAVPVERSDIAEFVSDVRQRPYGYTDVLGVPRSFRGHCEIVRLLEKLEPLAGSYMMG